METIAIDLDFTDVNTAGGLGVLPAGLYTGTIAKFRHFPDTNRLYVYIITNGVQTRESFGLGNPKSLPFLKAFLISAGVEESKVSGKSTVPFHKLAGREVYFNHTPADVDEFGKRKDGSYARYVFYPKAQFDQMSAWAPVVNDESPPAESVQIEVDSETKVKEGGGDDYDFLLDDDA